jgi:integrase
MARFSSRSGPSYLIKHRSILYFRIMVPRSLVAILGRSEVRVSLRTAYLSEARPKAARFAILYADLFAWLKGEMQMTRSTDELAAKARQWVKYELEKDEERRILGGPVSRELHNDQLEFNQLERERLREALAHNDYSGVVPFVKHYLSSNGETYDENSPDFKRLCYYLLKARIVKHDALELRDKGDYSNEYHPQLVDIARSVSPIQISSNSQSSSKHPRTNPHLTMRAAFESYKLGKLRNHRWNNSTAESRSPMIKTLIDIVGDRHPGDITRDDIRLYQDALYKLPARRNIRPEYKGKDISNLLNMTIPDADKLSTKTILDNLVAVIDFIKWLSQNYDEVDRGLGDVLSIPSMDKAPKEQREPFSNSDIIKIFHSKDYLNDKHDRPWKHWMPLLALFTGCRIEELAQLHKNDIKAESDIWVLDVNNLDDKSVKTINSNRLVPIHPKLVEIGFLDFINRLKASPRQTRVFPALKQSNKGRYGFSVSRWFNERYLINVGVREAGIKSSKSFHSFRHSFMHQTMLQELDRDKVEVIAGHKIDSGEYERYAKGFYPVKPLYDDVIARLDFNLDLSHCKNSKWSK